MAIVVKEEKNTKFLKFIPIGIVAALVIAGGYFTFFSETPLVANLSTPEGYDELEKISKLKIDVSGVVESPIWQTLRVNENIVQIDTTVTEKRTNPLDPFDSDTEILQTTNR